MRALRTAGLGALLLLAGSLTAKAQTTAPVPSPDPREEEMFGDEEAAPRETPQAETAPAQPQAEPAAADPDAGKGRARTGGNEFVPPEKERDQDLLGEDATPGFLSERRDLLDTDKLQIGGMLYLRFASNFYEGDMDDPTFSSPNLLYLFLDARPNDRIRGFVRGRMAYDPLTTGSQPGGPRIESFPMAGGTVEPDRFDVSLDQLWLKFDVKRALYITIGKQPIHWGTTRMWNPVDVVNSTRRIPLALFDERGGVYSLKLHVPIEKLSWNIIGLLLLEEVDAWDKAGGALRLETVFSTVELSLTGMVKQDKGADGSDYVLPKVALDLSAGIWDFDLTGEISMSFLDETRNDPLFTAGQREVLLQASAGLSYTGKYSADDYFIFGAEYFFNSDGYDGADDYVTAVQGMLADSLASAESLDDVGNDFMGRMMAELTPFYMGRHYLALYFLLPGPGKWDYTSFMASFIANLSDESCLGRLDVSATVLTYLTFQFYLMVNSGQRGGEFRMGFDKDELVVGSPAVPSPAMTLGLNLRIDL
jgi:hypothetical protein